MKHGKILLTISVLLAGAASFLSTGCEAYSGDLSSYRGNTSRSAYGGYGYGYGGFYDPWYCSGFSVGVGISVVPPPVMPPRPIARPPARAGF